MSPIIEEMVQRAFENNNSSSFADCRVAIGSGFEGILHVRLRSKDPIAILELWMITAYLGNRICHDRKDQCQQRQNNPQVLIWSLILDIISNNIKISLQKFYRNEKKKASYTRTTKQSKQNNQKRKQMQQTDTEVEEEKLGHPRDMMIESRYYHQRQMRTLDIVSQ